MILVHRKLGKKLITQKNYKKTNYSPLSAAPQGHGGVGGGGAGGQADHGGSRALPGRTGCADPNLKTDKKI